MKHSCAAWTAAHTCSDLARHLPAHHLEKQSDNVRLSDKSPVKCKESTVHGLTAVEVGLSQPTKESQEKRDAIGTTSGDW